MLGFSFKNSGQFNTILQESKSNTKPTRTQNQSKSMLLQNSRSQCHPERKNVAQTRTASQVGFGWNHVTQHDTGL